MGTNVAVDVDVEVIVLASRYPGAECRGREGPEIAAAAKNLLVLVPALGLTDFDFPGER